MLRDKWAFLEADFQRFYGKDLRLEVEREGARRLWALVQGLPQDAVLWGELRPQIPGVPIEKPALSGPDEIRNTLTKLMGGG